jgi:SEC-C motif-containing protein
MALESLQWPLDARALLEARYQAFVDGKIDFLLESHHPDARSQIDRQSIESWSRESKWQGLTIENEKVEHDRAVITFTVRYEKDFQLINHREHAEFRKADGKWFYYDSEFPKPESIRREGEKIGRNDPCSCGSGKKFKKCCGDK